MATAEMDYVNRGGGGVDITSPDLITVLFTASTSAPVSIATTQTPKKVVGLVYKGSAYVVLTVDIENNKMTYASNNDTTPTETTASTYFSDVTSTGFGFKLYNFVGGANGYAKLFVYYE